MTKGEKRLPKLSGLTKDRGYKYKCRRCGRVIRRGAGTPMNHADRVFYHKKCMQCAHGVIFTDFCIRCDISGGLE